mmetsp:Transcript_94045/g.265576  ORF Transcript_94045/g.265576 Transcript_94045/m.265576 type:complete len:242 (-) Transcript_94045:1286-2011(-)
MPSTLRPGFMADMHFVGEPFMISSRVGAPVLPKPMASNAPILMMVFSSTAVSMGSGSSPWSFLLRQTQRRIICTTNLMPCIDSVRLLIFSLSFASLKAFKCSASLIVIARCGALPIFSSFEIILSIGIKTKLFASRENPMAPKPSNKQMNIVRPEFRAASNFEPLRLSNTNSMCAPSQLFSFVRTGTSTVRSCQRISPGHSAAPHLLPTVAMEIPRTVSPTQSRVWFQVSRRWMSSGSGHW